MYNSVIFSMCTGLCHHYYYFQNILTPKRILLPISGHSPFLPPLTIAKAIIIVIKAILLVKGTERCNTLLMPKDLHSKGLKYIKSIYFNSLCIGEDKCAFSS